MQWHTLREFEWVSETHTSTVRWFNALVASSSVNMCMYKIQSVLFAIKMHCIKELISNVCLKNSYCT